MRYWLGWISPEEREWLRAGTAVHAALACWFKGGNLHETLGVLAAEYKTWSEQHVAPDSRLGWRNVLAVMRRWCETHPLSQFPFRVWPGMVEVGAQAPLVPDGSILYVGRMDVVGRDASGWLVGDSKTTAFMSASWLEQFDLDSQLTGYVWLLQQHLGEPVKGAFVNAIELSKLPDSTRKCAKHAAAFAECGTLHAKSEIVLTERTPAQIESWRWDAVRLAREYLDLIRLVPELAALHAANQRGRFNRACQNCDFKRFCKLDRPLDMVSAFFINSPWVPYDKLKQHAS